MKKMHCTSKVAGIRKSKLTNQKAVPQWEPATGYEDFYKPVGSIELRIEKFSEFARGQGMEAARWSALKSIRGLSWQIHAYPKEMDNQTKQSPSNALACYLRCQNESTDTAWYCLVKFTFRIVSKEGAGDYVKPAPKPTTYNGADSDCGYPSLITMDKLLDPEEGFIKDDTVILQVDLTNIILNGFQQDDEDRIIMFANVFGCINICQLFSSSTHYPWDCVLIIQGKRVHIQKNILSLHSEYFKEKFAEYKSIGRAILQNIDYEEFIELMCVIYPITYPIIAENVETVVRLAHVFKVHGILRQCETVLMMNSSKYGRIRTLLMSHWYGMEHLQAKCSAEIEAIGGPKKLKQEPEFTALDCRAKAILLDTIVESNPVMSSATNVMEPCVAALKARVSEISSKLASSALVDADGVLIVEDNKIPIHKLILAISSEYFKAMFLGEFKEKNQDEIVLEEVDHADILELLAVIYPCGYPVTDKNLQAVLKLADRFIMPTILERCKDVLKSSQKIKMALKLWLAQRYNLTDLQIEYAKEYKTVDDVKKLKAEPEYESFNDKTRSLIFDSITS